MKPEVKILRRRLRPSEKGRKLALWRIVMHGRIHDENGKKCQVCLESKQWGHRCCWECDRLHLCYPKWRHDHLTSEKTRYCPYSEAKFKHCERACHMYSKKIDVEVKLK